MTAIYIYFVCNVLLLYVIAYSMCIFSILDYFSCCCFSVCLSAIEHFNGYSALQMYYIILYITAP